MRPPTPDEVWWARFWRRLSQHPYDPVVTDLLREITETAEREGTGTFDELRPEAIAVAERLAVHLGMESRPG